MADVALRRLSLAGPIHAILLAFPVALFPSAMLADITYLNTQVIQWTNFSQWLIAGADLFAGLLLGWAIVSIVAGRARRARGRGMIYLLVVAAMFVLGVFNALHHARDGWHSVGTTGLVLSIVCTILAFVAAFLAHSQTTVEETPR